MNPIFSISRARSGKVRAFTLLELLTVIAIIGILVALTGPAINGLRKGNAMSSAVKQMLDDVANARLRAISDHTTVYMVFIPPINRTLTLLANPQNPLQQQEQQQFLRGQLSSYAFFVKRQAGDQPGQGRERYLTSWKTLPPGVVVVPNKFAQQRTPPNTDPVVVTFRDPAEPLGVVHTYRSFDYAMFPFPDTNCPPTYMPYIAFNYTGGLESKSGDVVIPLARGSLETHSTWSPPDFLEQPPGNSTNAYNLIVIDRLTGRAHHVSRRIQ